MADVPQPRRGARLPMLFCAGVFGIGRPQAAPSPPPAAPATVAKSDSRVISSSTAAPTPSDGTLPTLVTVPAPLRRHVPQLEMSGLTWAPEIGRYLVVIDDTVDSDDDARHGAFVLALDGSGVLDDQPLPVDGVDKIDDAEGITSDGKGTYYLQTSHSQNRRGLVKKPRRQLLRMKLKDRHLVVSGALDLLQGGEDVARQLAKLGVPADTGVDLEGLTYNDGALYIGLKWPLLSDGSALVMRMNHPDQVFSRGRLVDGDLVYWGQVKLTVPNDKGHVVSQGIADLQFARDGALYVCANAPKGQPKDGGGALWRVTPPLGGTMNATLVRRFVGLKPEGLTDAPKPKSNALVLVFDRDRKDPLWMTWQLRP